MTIKVLIVDDSRFFRQRLKDVIAKDKRLEVIGIAENGKEAIKQVELLKPDVITMDIEMPIMDGISATAHIMKTRPTPIFIISSWSVEGAQETLKALEAGATDYLSKRFYEEDNAAEKLCLQLRNVAESFQSPSYITKKVITPQHVKPSIKPSSTSQLKLIAIGASTGGTVAIQKILSALPRNFPLPILLIQHMPASFTPSFAERLNSQCAITVKHASHKDLLVGGTAYLAPGGQQMLIKGHSTSPHIEIIDNMANENYSPCIDITLSSVADIFPSQCLAIILTGMGNDGTQGCKKLKSFGSHIWSQDEQSSTIYGMPRSVANAGLTDKVLDLNDIAYQLAELH